MFIIYSSSLDQFVVETIDAPREEAREILLALRAANPDIGYGMAECPSEQYPDLDSLKAHAAKMHANALERQAKLDSMPPITGSTMTKEEWDAAMLLLDTGNRYQAANLAAHSWAYMPDEHGILLIGHGDYAYRLSGGTTEKISPAPQCCQTCKFCEDNLDRVERRAGKRTCRLGYQDSPWVSRPTLQTSICDGWKAR